MKKPKIRITLIDQKGTVGCHRGHKIGDLMILIRKEENYVLW